MSFGRAGSIPVTPTKNRPELFQVGFFYLTYVKFESCGCAAVQLLFPIPRFATLPKPITPRLSDTSIPTLNTLLSTVYDAQKISNAKSLGREAAEYLIRIVFLRDFTLNQNSDIDRRL